jgi:dipeptidyl aminopeptidase/acylaminoacyl peptidase
MSWAERLTHGLALARAPQLAPDGSRVAYLLQRARPPATAAEGDGATVAELWIADADLGGARRLAAPAAGVAHARWAPDGRRIAYVSAGELAVLALDEDAPAQVVAAPAGETIEELAWSPDGLRIAQVRSSVERGERVPRVVETVDFLLDGVGYTGTRRHRVVVSDVASGAERELAAGAQRCASLEWAPDGARLAFVGFAQAAIPELESQAQIASLDGDVRAIGPRDGQAVACAFSPSGRRLLVMGHLAAVRRGTAWRLLVYDADAGRLEAASQECACSRDSRPLWLDERRVLLDGVRAGASELATWDFTDGAAPRTIHRSRAVRIGLSADARRTAVVQEHASANEAGELVVRRLADERERVSTRNRDVLARSGPVAVERMRLGRAGVPLDVWALRRPDLDAAGPRPLVVDLQGGPQGFYGEGFYVRQQCLLRHGFVVAHCNPRGSSGYGGDFAARVNDSWGEDVEDVLRALDALCELPFVDAERVGVMGFSYGGYLTALALARDARFRAGVCGCPVFDVESWLWTSETADPRQYGFDDVRRASLDAQSPSSVVERIRAPVLLLHGEDDLSAPVGQSDWMFRTLKRLGREVAYVRYPGSSHSLMSSVPGYQLDLLSRLVAWFNRYLGEPAT